MREKKWQIWFWSKISSRALSSQWHLATLTHLEKPLSMRATPMSSSTLSGAANNKEYPINWPLDLREGRSPDVIYFWQVLFLRTSFNKFLVLIDLRLSFHSLRNFELISIFSGFEQQQIWERSKRHPRRPGAQHHHCNIKIDTKVEAWLLSCSLVGPSLTWPLLTTFDNWREKLMQIMKDINFLQGYSLWVYNTTYKYVQVLWNWSSLARWTTQLVAGQDRSQMGVCLFQIMMLIIAILGWGV